MVLKKESSNYELQLPWGASSVLEGSSSYSVERQGTLNPPRPQQLTSKYFSLAEARNNEVDIIQSSRNDTTDSGDLEPTPRQKAGKKYLLPPFKKNRNT